MSQLGHTGAVGAVGFASSAAQWGSGSYVQNGQGQSFVDTNGDVWMFPYGSATPVKIGVVHVQGGGGQVVLPSQMPVQWITSPGTPAPADPPSPAADASAWLRALDMMDREKKKSKPVIRCDPDLAEAWND